MKRHTETKKSRIKLPKLLRAERSGASTQIDGPESRKPFGNSMESRDGKQNIPEK
jgi:hypothetical protein